LEGISKIPLESQASRSKVQVLDDLEEATIYEHVFSRTLLERIERFKKWLAQRDEETIVIVGHSQYFKKMLGLKTLMRNCDVWQCDFSSGFDGQTAISSSSIRKYQWTNLTLLHRTLLADVHPYDKLTKTKEGGEEKTNGDNIDISGRTDGEDRDIFKATLIKPGKNSRSDGQKDTTSGDLDPSIPEPQNTHNPQICSL
jgi:hypothetical protein